MIIVDVVVFPREFQWKLEIFDECYDQFTNSQRQWLVEIDIQALEKMEMVSVMFSIGIL